VVVPSQRLQDPRLLSLRRPSEAVSASLRGLARARLRSFRRGSSSCCAGTTAQRRTVGVRPRLSDVGCAATVSFLLATRTAGRRNRSWGVATCQKPWWGPINGV